MIVLYPRGSFQEEGIALKGEETVLMADSGKYTFKVLKLTGSKNLQTLNGEERENSQTEWFGNLCIE